VALLTELEEAELTDPPSHFAGRCLGMFRQEFGCTRFDENIEDWFIDLGGTQLLQKILVSSFPGGLAIGLAEAFADSCHRVRRDSLLPSFGWVPEPFFDIQVHDVTLLQGVEEVNLLFSNFCSPHMCGPCLVDCGSEVEHGGAAGQEAVGSTGSEYLDFVRPCFDFVSVCIKKLRIGQIEAMPVDLARKESYRDQAP
jgi:hypothetical protein